jgi:hypothetical protein
LTPIVCSQVRDYLAAFDDPSLAPEEVARHLAGCSMCRAEQRAYRDLVSDLAGLKDVEVATPAWLLGSLTESTLERVHQRQLLEASLHRLSDRKVLAGSAILVAGVAGAAWLMRGRSQRRSARASSPAPVPA